MNEQTTDTREEVAKQRCPHCCTDEEVARFGCVLACGHNGLVGSAEDILSRLEKAEAANREKDAEIERLKQHLATVQHIALNLHDQRDENRVELASLRASVGEKWIEIKEGCEVPEHGEMIHAICTSSIGDPWQEIFEATFTGWEEMLECGNTHWKRLNWPAPPTKDKE